MKTVRAVRHWGAVAAIMAGAGVTAAVLALRGALTVDLGIGRSVRPLGPIRTTINAPREVVFDVISDPYLRRTPRAMEAKLHVLERGSDLVLAAHFTPIPGGLVATTVETVHFDRPRSISFRLVRGPVPYVTETFELREHDTGAEFIYSGEMERTSGAWDAGGQAPSPRRGSARSSSPWRQSRPRPSGGPGHPGSRTGRACAAALPGSSGPLPSRWARTEVRMTSKGVGSPRSSSRPAANFSATLSTCDRTAQREQRSGAPRPGGSNASHSARRPGSRQARALSRAP